MKKAKRILALVLAVVFVMLTMAIPASAASKVDPSEGIGAKIEATFYQLVDKMVFYLGKVLNILIPGLNFGDRWQEYDSYVSPDGYMAGEEAFDTEVKAGAQWSAGYAYGSLLEGLDIFDGSYYMANGKPKESKIFWHIKGSHQMDSKEMSRLIDCTVEEAKALGIETMTPAELERMIKAWKTK